MNRSPVEPAVGAVLLEELLSSRVRAAVLCQLLPRPHLGFSLTELSRLLGLPISSLQHECYKLERLGILMGRREGNAYRYRGNAESSLNGPLTALVVAAIGEEAALRATLDAVPGVHAAFLAGDVPKSGKNGGVPLVVIGEVPLEALDALESRPAAVLNLPTNAIELAYYRPDDWRAKLQQANPFVMAILNGNRLDLISNDGLIPAISS
jgi:DNA-binding transcriptional ArsR family regulator